MTRVMTRSMTTAAAIAFAMTARAQAQHMADAGAPPTPQDAGVASPQPAQGPSDGGAEAATPASGGTAPSAAPQTPAALEAASTAPAIRHLPPSSLAPDQAFLQFEVTHPEVAGRIVVNARRRGSHDVVQVTARRSGYGFEARLPDSLRRPPAIEYWVVERRADGTDVPVFASQRSPHRVAIRVPDSASDAQRALEDRGGHLSRLGVSGEYVDFGDRQLSGVRHRDRYYRAEASYSYAILSVVEEVKISVGLVRGEAATGDIGINYGGGSITWRAMPIVRIETSLLFGYSQTGFEYGGGTSLVLGSPRGTTFTLGVEGVSTLGWTGRVRLGWLVVPRVPMAASIELTSYPAGEDTGVRLLQEIGYNIYPGALLRVRAGYQGRTNVTGGPAVAADLVLAF